MIEGKTVGTRVGETIFQRFVPEPETTIIPQEEGPAFLKKSIEGGFIGNDGIQRPCAKHISYPKNLLDAHAENRRKKRTSVVQAQLMIAIDRRR